VIDSTATSPPTRGRSSARVRIVRVIGVAGRRATTAMLESSPLTIGREGHVAGPLGIADSEASRQHAVIEPGPDDTWVIVDQDSRNGTFVDGARVARATLRDGSVIRVGKTVLLFADAEVRATDDVAAPTDTALIGTSLAMLRVHGDIAMVAPHEVPVLVLGETGVGKELVAEEIHRRSGRTGAFIPVNCAAISPQLAESELFGHVAGAFTGASKQADGLFVAANGGTLFLDEIGELPLELQPKLLRALAKGEVRAVGSSVAVTVDVRVIAATLRDLGADVAATTFRADLFNRLSGWRVEVPPLRARRDDVIAIANAYLAKRAAPPLSVDAAEALLVHDWPGNVRELEQVLATAVIRAAGAPPGSELELEHLPTALADALGDRARVEVAAAAAQIPLAVTVARDQTPTKDELCAALERYDGNVARVAEHFEKDRQQVYRWARRFGIDLESFRKV
jgi:sigma-54 dependent transcriptional regulator, acetoin dehydrogenase operon transcriptional activator AcoR